MYGDFRQSGVITLLQPKRMINFSMIVFHYFHVDCNYINSAIPKLASWNTFSNIFNSSAMPQLFERKNKWLRQKIHKKYNLIQYASKHYIYANQQKYEGNDLIFKKKYPYKQRKDRKKFRAQRFRKKLYKRLAFDVEDYMLGNKTENHKRIQIRPTISYPLSNIARIPYPAYNHETFCDPFPGKSNNTKSKNNNTQVASSKISVSQSPIEIKVKYWLKDELSKNDLKVIHGSQEIIHQGRLKFAQFKFYLDNQLLSSVIVRSDDWINDYDTNLQNTANKYLNQMAPSNWSCCHVTWDYNECYQNIADYLGVVPKWRDDCFVRKYNMTGIILEFTDHVFDTIPGLVMMIGSYIKRKYIAYFEVKGRLFLGNQTRSRIVRDIMGFEEEFDLRLPESQLQKKLTKADVVTRVDIYDIAYWKWYPGRIITFDSTLEQCKVHYDGYNSNYDEWIDVNSDRLAPLYTYTKAPKLSCTAEEFSPTPPAIQEFYDLPVPATIESWYDLPMPATVESWYSE